MKKLLLVLAALVIGAGFVFAEEAEKLDKEKKALGFSPFKNEVSMRFWPSETLGIDVIGGITYESGDESNFNLQVAGNIVLPVFEQGIMSFNMLPGLRFGFDRTAITAGIDVTNTKLTFAGTFGFEFEVLLKGLTEDVTIGSNVGAAIGMKSTTFATPDDSETETGFVALLASDFAINPIYIRYYFK
jgi:hypothetical protein